MTIGIFVILFFTTCYLSLFFNNLSKNELSRYYIIVASKQLKIDRIYKDKRHDDLKQAVERQNEKDLLALREYKLKSVCERLSYGDIESIDKSTLKEGVKVFAVKYTLGFFAVWRLKRVIRRILSGKVKIDRLTEKDILTNREFEKIRKNRLKPYVKKRTVKRNIKKSISFIIITVVFAIVAFAKADASIVATIVKKLSLFLSAAGSGLTAAAFESKFIADVYDEQNKFIVQNLDITDKYEPELVND